jgi:hypothetical protein
MPPHVLSRPAVLALLAAAVSGAEAVARHKAPVDAWDAQRLPTLAKAGFVVDVRE